MSDLVLPSVIYLNPQLDIALLQNDLMLFLDGRRYEIHTQKFEFGPEDFLAYIGGYLVSKWISSLYGLQNLIRRVSSSERVSSHFTRPWWIPLTIVRHKPTLKGLEKKHGVQETN